jgi:hypothetical protein
MDAVKARMKTTWMEGDYGTFAQYMEPGAQELLAAWQILPGSWMWLVVPDSSPSLLHMPVSMQPELILQQIGLSRPVPALRRKVSLPSLTAGWAHYHGQLDTIRLCRSDIQSDFQAYTPTSRCAIAIRS